MIEQHGGGGAAGEPQRPPLQRSSTGVTQYHVLVSNMSLHMHSLPYSLSMFNDLEPFLLAGRQGGSPDK
jgi:hypothetical protein